MSSWKIFVKIYINQHPLFRRKAPRLFNDPAAAPLSCHTLLPGVTPSDGSPRAIYISPFQGDQKGIKVKRLFKNKSVSINEVTLHFGEGRGEVRAGVGWGQMRPEQVYKSSAIDQLKSHSNKAPEGRPPAGGFVARGKQGRILTPIFQFTFGHCATPGKTETHEHRPRSNKMICIPKAPDGTDCPFKNEPFKIDYILPSPEIGLQWK